MPRSHFPHLDALRAVAVILVLVYHLIVVLQWTTFPTSGIFDLFRIGWVGVELFFTLSGFVITLSCLRNIQTSGPGYRRPFMISRLARIVPLYLLTSWCQLVLVEPQLFKAPGSIFWTNLLTHLFFVHNLTPQYAGALNGPAWSIGVEMQFYVFMAIAFVWLPFRRPLLLGLVSVLMALAWRALCVQTFDPATEDLAALINRTQQLPGTLDAFGLGCMLALITQRPDHWAHRFTVPGWRNMLMAGAIALCLSVLSWHLFWPRAGFWGFPGMVIGFRLLLALTFGSWLWLMITLPATRALRLVLKPFVYIGTISYGIYLWHMLVILSITRIGYAPNSKAAMLITLLTVTISMFSWHFFEKPLVRRFAAHQPGSRQAAQDGALTSAARTA